jgi:hypothetical protein
MDRLSQCGLMPVSGTLLPDLVFEADDGESQKLWRFPSAIVFWARETS